MRCRRLEFRAVRVGELGHVACEFDHGKLHAQADAQVGHAVLTSETNRLDLAFGAAATETARHENRIEMLERIGAVLLDLLGIDVLDIHARFRVDGGVTQRFDERLVRFGQIDILADHADGDVVLRILDGLHQTRPHGQVGRLGFDFQFVADDLVHALVMEHLRNLVDRVDVPDRNHGVLRDVREQRNLGALVFRNLSVGAAQQHVRRNADLAQFLHAVLGRLGLEFACRGNVRHQRQVHEGHAVAAQAQVHLTGGFKERQRLDVADRTADLDDGDVGMAVPRRTRAALDKGLNFIGDVRNDLNGLAEILAAALLADHRFVDLARREVVRTTHLGADEALVMAQIEIGFRTVLGHKHLAVLERAHCARVDVDVGIKLEEGDFEATRFENRGQRCGSNSLTKRGNHAARDKNEFGHRSNCSRESRIIPESRLALDVRRGKFWS